MVTPISFALSMWNDFTLDQMKWIWDELDFRHLNIWSGQKQFHMLLAYELILYLRPNWMNLRWIGL